jgi:hypothetical protein
MKELRYIAPTGMVGSGFVELSFWAGIERLPAFIGSDGGSTDEGPYQLGAGKPMFAREACKRDLCIMLQGARSQKIPLFVIEFERTVMIYKRGASPKANRPRPAAQA